MAKKKSMLQRFLASFGSKKTESTKKIEQELEKSGISKEEMSSDVEKAKQERNKRTSLTGKERAIPPTTKENIDRAHKIAMEIKRRREQNKRK